MTHSNYVSKPINTMSCNQGCPSPPGAVEHASPPPQFRQDILHIRVSRQIAIKSQEGNQL